ncbi:MAG: glycosyl hydrolase [Sphingobacteriales bacterium]|nr:glycosyl hydrolase [Sphingobacteriales bacterium]
MIWKPIAVCAMVVTLSSYTPAVSNKQNEKKQTGWKALFDGKTTKGWHTYGKSEAGSSWLVDNGTLHLTTSGNADHGDLVTDEEYSNFHLKLEWKIAKNGNSGIIFFVNEDPAKYPATYNTGMEMQVLDNDGHPDAKIYKHRAGDLYDLIASSKETVKPFGEWNQVDIISNNGKLDLILNGTTVVSTTMWDENWKSLIAGNKFKTMPGFGINISGKIALQDHGDEVWYRNIKIQKL